MNKKITNFTDLVNKFFTPDQVEVLVDMRDGKVSIGEAFQKLFPKGEIRSGIKPKESDE